MPDYSVEFDDRVDGGRFVIDLGKGQEAELLYRSQDGNVWDAYRTFVPGAFEGQGLAGKLVVALVGAAREKGVKIRPACSYIAAWAKRHKEHASLFV